MFFKQIHNLCAITILVSFFLPWFHVFFISVPAYKFINYVNSLGEIFAEHQSIPFYLYFIYLFPLLSAIILFISIRNKDAGVFSLVSGVIFILWFTFFFIKTSIEVGMLGVGVYFTIIGSLGLIISSFIKSTK